MPSGGRTLPAIAAGWVASGIGADAIPAPLLLPRNMTRQMRPPSSSAMNSAPSGPTASPVGRRAARRMARSDSPAGRSARCDYLNRYKYEYGRWRCRFPRRRCPRRLDQIVQPCQAGRRPLVSCGAIKNPPGGGVSLWECRPLPVLRRPRLPPPAKACHQTDLDRCNNLIVRCWVWVSFPTCLSVALPAAGVKPAARRFAVAFGQA